MIIVTPNRLQSRGSSINPPLNGRLHSRWEENVHHMCSQNYKGFIHWAYTKIFCAKGITHTNGFSAIAVSNKRRKETSHDSSMHPSADKWVSCAFAIANKLKDCLLKSLSTHHFSEYSGEIQVGSDQLPNFILSCARLQFMTISIIFL